MKFLGGGASYSGRELDEDSRHFEEMVESNDSSEVTDLMQEFF